MEVGFRNDIILHSSAAIGVCMGASFLCKLSVEISLLQHRNLNLKEARAIHVDARTYPSRKESSKPLPSHSPSPMLARSCALSLSLPSLSPSLFFSQFSCLWASEKWAFLFSWVHDWYPLWCARASDFNYQKKKKENQYRRGGQSMAGSDHEWARGVV